MINESILTKSGLDTYHAELLKYVKNLIKTSENPILEYASSLQFPTTGEEGKIYVDMAHNKLYRWDDTNIKYYCVGSDYENINIINCGDSTI